MYNLDEKSVIRRSHENPAVLKLYKDWLGKVCFGGGGLLPSGRP